MSTSNSSFLSSSVLTSTSSREIVTTSKSVRASTMFAIHIRGSRTISHHFSNDPKGRDVCVISSRSFSVETSRKARRSRSKSHHVSVIRLRASPIKSGKRKPRRVSGFSSCVTRRIISARRSVSPASVALLPVAATKT